MQLIMNNKGPTNNEALQVDAGVMAELLQGVAASVLPLLRDQLTALNIPPVNEQIGV